jgi:hypothetical protein
MLKAPLGSNPPAYGTNYGGEVPAEPQIPAQTPAQYLVAPGMGIHGTGTHWHGLRDG